MYGFIYYSKQTTFYVHVGGLRELIFPGKLRKMEHLVLNIMAFLCSRTHLWAVKLDCSQIATVAFEVTRQLHSPVY